LANRATKAISRRAVGRKDIAGLWTAGITASMSRKALDSIARRVEHVAEFCKADGLGRRAGIALTETF
jgi:hypothetical protein